MLWCWYMRGCSCSRSNGSAVAAPPAPKAAVVDRCVMRLPEMWLDCIRAKGVFGHDGDVAVAYGVFDCCELLRMYAIPHKEVAEDCVGAGAVSRMSAREGGRLTKLQARTN